MAKVYCCEILSSCLKIRKGRDVLCVVWLDCKIKCVIFSSCLKIRKERDVLCVVWLDCKIKSGLLRQ